MALVPLFDGELTPVILQTFLRTHGADKPQVTKSDYGYIAESSVCLPLHIASSEVLELDPNEWRQLMQSLGYEVPAKKTSSNPILNFNTNQKIFTPGLYGNDPKGFELKKITKEELKNTHTDRKRIRKSQCGTFRFRTILINRAESRGYWDTDEYAVFLTDSKVHEIPESMQLPMLEEA